MTTVCGRCWCVKCPQPINGKLRFVCPANGNFTKENPHWKEDL